MDDDSKATALMPSPAATETTAVSKASPVALSSPAAASSAVSTPGHDRCYDGEDAEDEDVQQALRFGDIGKFLAVVPGLLALLYLYVVYTFFHCCMLMQLDLPRSQRNHEKELRGVVELVVFHVLTGTLLYCLASTVVVHPGTIPPETRWRMPLSPTAKSSIPGTTETKDGSTAPRFCKWCLKYKPDRCHHCRICCLCILKMDHHCPMVYNCIGFCNHKYFFLLLVYATIDLSLISLTLWESVLRAIHWDLSLEMMLALAGAEALAMSLLAAIAYFLSFHVWLVSQGLTTLEYVERKGNKPNWRQKYDLGLYQNICNVLGPNPLLWLLPLSHPTGDGVIWATAE
mmetsp:Transcript_14020/g.31765  ORF Transcript_14020/g.31765 Transcript_14020/m.31765 type:complete len:344 (+) Transcript_14020:63-1094(+)